MLSLKHYAFNRGLMRFNSWASINGVPPPTPSKSLEINSPKVAEFSCVKLVIQPSAKRSWRSSSTHYHLEVWPSSSSNTAEMCPSVLGNKERTLLVCSHRSFTSTVVAAYTLQTNRSTTDITISQVIFQVWKSTGMWSFCYNTVFPSSCFGSND